MKWIPSIFEPMGPIMAALVVAWYLAIALALHKLSRYVLQRRRNRLWPRLIDTTVSALQRNRTAIVQADPLVA
jgi:hypothetical protein